MLPLNNNNNNNNNNKKEKRKIHKFQSAIQKKITLQLTLHLTQQHKEQKIQLRRPQSCVFKNHSYNTKRGGISCATYMSQTCSNIFPINCQNMH